jgi:hypothetical protein
VVVVGTTVVVGGSVVVVVVAGGMVVVVVVVVVVVGGSVVASTAPRMAFPRIPSNIRQTWSLRHLFDRPAGQTTLRPGRRLRTRERPRASDRPS